MIRITRFYPLKNAGKCNYLQVELRYEKGGYNPFTSKSEPRGYYFSIGPVERSGVCIAAVAFSGKKWCIKEVARYSKKQATEMAEQFKERISEYIKLGFPQYEVDLSSFEEKDYS